MKRGSEKRARRRGHPAQHARRAGRQYRDEDGRRANAMRDVAVVGGVEERGGVEEVGDGDFVLSPEEVRDGVEGGSREGVDVEVAVIVAEGVCSQLCVSAPAWQRECMP